MRKLSNSGAMSEARRFKTLILGRATGSGGVGVAIPQPTAQNQMVIASATPAWTLLAAPAAEGQVLIAGADPYTPVWSTTFPAVIQFDAGLTFGGATGTNVVTVPGNAAQAVHLVDAGGIEYMRIRSLDSQPGLTFNESGADIDFCVEAVGAVAALFVRGSDGYVGVGVVPEAPFHVHGLAQFDDGVTFAGATSFNIITVPDNVAQAMHIVDVGAIEYLRIISTNTQPVVVFNEGGADVDHRWKASGQANAVFIQGSSGYVALGHDDPDMLFHIRSGVMNEAHILLEECAATANAPDVYFRKGRGSCASPVDVDVGDSLSGLYFTGYRNSDWRNAAVITSQVEALGVSAVRAGIIFSTTNDSDVLAERMRINRNGKVTIIENSAMVRLSGTKELAITITSPEVGTYGQIRIPWDCTVTRVDGNIIGGTSCTVNPEERGTLGSSGTDILSSDMVADADGESVTSSFNNSSLAAGNYLTFDVSAVSGAVSEVNIAVTVILT